MISDTADHTGRLSRWVVKQFIEPAWRNLKDPDPARFPRVNIWPLFTAMPTNIDQNASWREKSEAKKASVLQGVPTAFLHQDLTCSYSDTRSVHEIPPSHLSPEELALTKLETVEIIAGISRGQYTAVQVLDAFTHRAAIAHKLLNCCLEFRYQDARAEAEKLDQHYRNTGKTVGPLHGLPISVKDQCRIAGTETTCGFVYKVGVKDTEDCTLVRCLKEAGAVIFVKTNLSTGCLWGETINKCDC